MKPRLTRVRAGACEVEVSTWPGDDALTPLLLLHEGLGCIELWRDFPADLQRACGGPTVVAYSREGYGRSSALTGPRASNFLHDEALVALPDVVAATLERRPMLVGHSDGASIALINAAMTGGAAALLLLAPHAYVEPATVDGVRRARHDYLIGDLRTRLARYHDNVDRAFFGWCDVWESADFASWSVEDLLDDIRCPAVVVQGLADQYATPEHARRIGDALGGWSRTELLPDVGHQPHHEARAEVLALAADVHDRIR